MNEESKDDIMSRMIVKYPKSLSSMSHLRNGFMEEDSDDELFDYCISLRTRLDSMYLHLKEINFRIKIFRAHLPVHILNVCLKELLSLIRKRVVHFFCNTKRY